MHDAVFSNGLVDTANRPLLSALEDDYDSLGRSLERRGVAIDAIKEKVKAFAVAVPSWGVGVGGTRFAKFPIPGEPTNIFEKLEDCAVVHALGRATPTVSPHFPWDKVDDDRGAEGDRPRRLGLAFDAVNSNTFQDQPGQSLPTSSAPSLTPTPRCVIRPWRTTSSASTSARRLGVTGADGLDRATAPTSPASPTWPARSTAISTPWRTSTPPCPRPGGCSSSTSCMSRPSTPP